MIEIVNHVDREHWQVWVSALVASSAVGRWAMVLVMSSLPPIASRNSVSRDIAGQLNRRDVILATLWTLPAVIWFASVMPWQAAIAVLLLVPTLIWFVRYVRRRIGGSTGDCLGCIGYITQLLVLLSAAARWQG